MKRATPKRTPSKPESSSQQKIDTFFKTKETGSVVTVSGRVSKQRFQLPPDSNSDSDFESDSAPSSKTKLELVNETSENKVTTLSSVESVAVKEVQRTVKDEAADDVKETEGPKRRKHLIERKEEPDFSENKPTPQTVKRRKVTERTNSKSSGDADIEDLPQHHSMDSEQKNEFQQNLLEWYDSSKRDLPWRTTLKEDATDEEIDARAYRIWVSELMLQQTSWMKKWPTVVDLAAATIQEVNELWAGLGYYRRANYLLEGAKKIVKDFGGRFPRSREEIMSIPGIGEYTCGAIGSIAFGHPWPLVDGNVIRVFSRIFALGLEAKEKQMDIITWKIAHNMVYHPRSSDWNQSLMELGATVCTPLKPSCSTCPVRKHCMASNRFSIGKMMNPQVKSDSQEVPQQNKRQVQTDCNLCGDLKGIPSVEGYPLKSKKKERREEYIATSVLSWRSSSNDCEDMYLLLKRPETGLLASMMEFPTKTTDADSSENTRQETIDSLLEDVLIGYKGMLRSGKLNVASRYSVGSLVHHFTHIHQTIFIERMKLSGSSQPEINPAFAGACWVGESSLNETALSTGMMKSYELSTKTKPKTKPKASSKPSDTEN